MPEPRVAVVTGALGGLGSAICERLAADGAVTFPVDLRGPGCFEADLATRKGNIGMIEAALEEHGRIDALILNAGMQHLAPIAEFPEPVWDRMMDLMVKGPFLAIRAAWEALGRHGSGAIVVTASGCSFVGEAYKSAYVAAKHAVNGLVKVAALEGVAHGIRANAVAPGWMMTGMVESQLAAQMELHSATREEVLARFAAEMPGGRFVETLEVARVIAFLASPVSSGINGSCLPVDRGALIG
jgi:3-hydroxybutyrate dehydrogenase